jgi:type II secretory pathway component PulF
MQSQGPEFNSQKKLSPEEAAEFAARVAELTKAGLPLGGGLRALSEELPGRRSQQVLRDMADRLDAGDDLVAALESQGGSLPEHLRGLMLAGIRNGRLAEVLEEYVELQHSQSELRRRVWMTLAYPFILLLFIAAISVLAGVYLVPAFAKMFYDFRMSLPAMTVLVLNGSAWMMQFFLGIVVIAIVVPILLCLWPSTPWVWAAVYRVPMVGPLLRWGHLAQFTRLMGLLLEQGVSLADALRATAAGLSNGGLARTCRRVADDVERGWPLDESMATQRLFPASLIPMIQWGRWSNALPEAFRGAAEMFEGRVRSQGVLLETVLLPVMFLAISVSVGFFIVALFLPMFSFISLLSSGGGSYDSGGQAGTSPETEVTVLSFIFIILVAILSALGVLVLRRLRSGTWDELLLEVLGYFRILGTIVVALLLLVILSFFLQFMGFIAWMVLAFLVVEGMRKYRAMRQYGLLWLLTVSAERSMPLAPAIEAFVQERGGRFSRRAKRLAEMLNRGVPLPDALERCPGLLPRYAAPAIRVGHETGTLAHALRRAAAVHSTDEPVWVALQGKIAYLMLLPAFGILVLTFIMWYIVPAFIKIFSDFQIVMPEMTRSLIDISFISVNYWFLLFPLYVLGPALLFYLPIRYFGWTDWDLPGMGRLTRRLDSAEILDTLSFVARQQMPLPQGIAGLAHSYPKKRIRMRLCQAATDVMLGHDWCESLLKHGLICRGELVTLQAAQRVGNLPWALTEMADSVRRRLVYRVQAVTQFLFPPIVILMGLVVMYTIVALFLPLVTLIEKLT